MALDRLCNVCYFRVKDVTVYEITGSIGLVAPWEFGSPRRVMTILKFEVCAQLIRPTVDDTK